MCRRTRAGFSRRLLGALSPQLFRRMRQLADAVFALDVKIAKQTILPSLPTLGNLHSDAHALEYGLPETVLGLFLEDCGGPTCPGSSTSASGRARPDRA